MDERVTRREALAKAMAVAAGAMAVTMLPATAIAADTDNMVIGTTNEGSSDTVLTSGTEGTTLQVDNTHAHDGDGGGSAGVKATGFIGVRAASVGVKTFQGPGWGPMGVLGEYTAPVGDAQARGTGVHGRAWDGRGVGVQGDSGIGQSGVDSLVTWEELDGTGVVGRGITRGVLAASSGTALDVRGKASFSRSGRGRVSKGHSSTTVVVSSGLSSTSYILVTLQNGGSGVYLKYAARTDATHFKVVLSKTATSNTYFVWLVVN